MPDIASFHPQLVHFVIGLGIAGVVLRLLSLTGRVQWSRNAAPWFLIIAAIASVVAAESGDQAHDLAERIPGVRDAVHEHEEAGEYARNLLLAVGLIELVALALRRSERVAHWLLMASGLVGIGACAALYSAGEHGGLLVYSYAGGVGTRTGDPADVRRLLIAGLFHEARLARDSGHADEAARLTEELGRQAQDDPAVKLLAIESQLKDRNDPKGALAALADLQTPEEDRFSTIRKGLLTADAHVALGQPDSARLVLTDLAQRFPQARSVQDALHRLP
jgi:uncharacterized membrane protein